MQRQLVCLPTELGGSGLKLPSSDALQAFYSTVERMSKHVKALTGANGWSVSIAGHIA